MQITVTAKRAAAIRWLTVTDPGARELAAFAWANLMRAAAVPWIPAAMMAQKAPKASICSCG